MQVDKKIITSVLNNLGLFDGLLYLEKQHHLQLNKELHLRYWYHNRENVDAYFYCEELFLFSLPASYSAGLNRLELEEGLIGEFARRSHDDIRLDNEHHNIGLAEENIIWHVCQDNGELSYVIRLASQELSLRQGEIRNQLSVYDARQWVIHYSFSSWEGDLNLISLLPRELLGEYDMDSDRAFQHQRLLVEFTQLINNYGLAKMYAMWKRMACMISPMPMQFFADNPLLRDYLYGGRDAEYFDTCKDIVLGVPVRFAGRGIDRAMLEWGARTLVERLVSPLSDRRFSIAIEYNVARMSPVSRSSSLVLGQSSLGWGCLGSQCPDPWRALCVVITTSSWEVHTLLAPDGRAAKFVREVLDTWLSPQGIESDMRMQYRGPVGKFCFVLGGGERPGFATLGHATFLCPLEQMDLPSKEECRACLDTDSLVDRFV